MSIYNKLLIFKEKEVSLIKDTQAYNYSYANLKQIQDKLNPILKELKLIVFHYNKGNEVVTQIRDTEDDSFIESSLEIGQVETTVTYTDKKGKDNIEYNSKDPQGVGSIITYYRRYNLISLLDLEIEDDDGAKGSGRAKSNYTKPVQDDDNKEWYNDFDKHQDLIIERLKNGETAKDIIGKLTQKYKVNKKVRQSIEDLETDNK